jgi:hypothetical protein
MQLEPFKQTIKMNKLFSITSAAIFLLLASCTSTKQDCTSETTKKNIEAMHGIFNCFNTNDFSKLGDYVAEDCIDHASGTSGTRNSRPLCKSSTMYQRRPFAPCIK